MADFSLLIKNGRIIDGTGAKPFNADLAVDNGKIMLVGRCDSFGASARRVIDAAGMCVTPGFIDIHRHADAAVFRPGFGQCEISQGLTTIVNGNCGLSAAPLCGPYKEEIKRYLRPITGEIPDDMPCGSMKEYLDAVRGLPINTYMLAGAGTARAVAAGYATERLSDEHYSRIHRLLDESLEAGALGISLGLGYSPECFYTTKELIRALEPVRNTDIPVTVHMRQEGAGVLKSVREMITVGRELSCPIHISHLKAMGRDNWGRLVPQALSLIEAAINEGLDITCDVYPYTAGSTQLMHILPPDFLAGGPEKTAQRLKTPAARRELAERIADGSGFDNIAALAGWDGIILTSLMSEKNKCYEGMSIEEIARVRKESPLDACCDLLAEEQCQITMIDYMASEDDIAAILKAPFSNLISDATYPNEGRLHPRVYGTFTRLIEHFVIEKEVISLEEAVNKMTLMPAKALRLNSKGVIAPGADADICIFKPEELHERASYLEPCRVSEGMKAVIVGGKVELFSIS